MFSAIGILTGTSVYIFVSGSSENAAESRSADLAAGPHRRLKERRAHAASGTPDQGELKDSLKILQQTRPSEHFRTWIYALPREGNPAQARHAPESSKLHRRRARGARGRCRPRPRRLVGDSDLPEGRTLVATPLFSTKGIGGGRRAGPSPSRRRR